MCEIFSTCSSSDEPMRVAIELARAAGAEGEVPVGAVVTDEAGVIIARAENRMRRDNCLIAHAEMLVIGAAMRALGQDRLGGCDLWVTLEPCAMCAGAIALSRLRRVYFGAYDAKSGAVEHGPCLLQQPSLHHKPEIYGGMSERICAELMKQFFAEIR